MKTLFIAVVLSFFAASNPLFAYIDIFQEIEPSNKYHTKLILKKQKHDNLLLTLPKVKGATDLQAWLVVCEKPREKGRRNFRYEVRWPESKANKSDIELVIPIKFEKSGIANIQLTDDLASRSYIVFGRCFMDGGTFYTVNLPAFRKALDKQPKGEQVVDPNRSTAPLLKTESSVRGSDD